MGVQNFKTDRQTDRRHAIAIPRYMHYSASRGKNDESLCGDCTNERRVRKRDKKVRRDVI